MGRNTYSCILTQNNISEVRHFAGAASIASVMSIKGKSIFYQSNCIPDVKFFDNLIGWTLANTHDATLEEKSSLFQTLAMLCWHENHIENQAVV